MPLKQRGAALITAIFIIVVMSLLAAAASFLRVSDTAGNLDYQASDQAFFLAESGLEQAGLSLTTGTCAGVAALATNLGRGSYTIVSGTVISGGCRVRARGNVGAAARTLEGDFSFLEHFPDAADFANWTIVTIANTSNPAAGAIQGYSTALGNAPGSDGGHILGEPDPTGANDRLNFTATRLLGTASFVATAGTTNLSFLWRKTNQMTNSNNPQILRIHAIDTTDTAYLLWEDTVRRNDAAWTAQGPTVPTPVGMAGKTINRIQLYFDLHQQANNNLTGAFDFIRFNLTITGWREIVF